MIEDDGLIGGTLIDTANAMGGIKLENLKYLVVLPEPESD